MLSENINEAKKYNPLAQTKLFDLMAPRQLMLCRRYIRNRQDAEEVMMDGFTRLFKSINNFENGNDELFYAYVKKIMINACVRHLERDNTFFSISENFIPHTPVVEDVFAGRTPHIIHQLISQLPAGFRTVLNLYAIDGYEHREIAALLKISESTSRSQLARARTMLQTKLALTEKKYTNESSK